MSGPQFLRALLRGGAVEVFMVGIGVKVPFVDFAAIFEDSVDNTAPITLDMGKTRLYPDRDYMELFEVGDAHLMGRKAFRLPSVTHRSVHCRTYPLCGGTHGSLHYSVGVSAAPSTQVPRGHSGWALQVLCPLLWG